MIQTAIQKGSQVYVYNEKNCTLFIKEGILMGYTSQSVSIKKGNSVYTYNDRGTTVSIH